MQSSTPAATGMFARLGARLRGDKFMVDAYPAPAVPDTSPAPAPVPPREPRGEQG